MKQIKQNTLNIYLQNNRIGLNMYGNSRDVSMKCAYNITMQQSENIRLAHSGNHFNLTVWSG